MLKETDETYHQMELEEYFQEEITPNMFAVSRIFAEARKQMNLAEYKTFTLALCSIKWQDACPEVLYIDKKDAARVIGMEADADHLSQNLKREIGNLPQHSFLQFADKDKDEWVNGCFVVSVGYFKKRLRIRLNTDYLGLFGNLDKDYITMWSGDIFKLHSERAVVFYELLRDNSDTRLDVNYGTMSIRKFKEIFKIPKEGKGSYMRDAKNGGFDRTQFEKYVIDPVCEDLAHTDMIRLIMQPDGKYYEKVKKGGRVIAYKLYWEVTMHPGVADAHTVRQLQERIDKNPQVLKVVKDFVNGNKKPKQKAAGFNNFAHSGQDWDEIGRQIMEKQEQEHKERFE